MAFPYSMSIRASMIITRPLKNITQPMHSLTRFQWVDKPTYVSPSSLQPSGTLESRGKTSGKRQPIPKITPRDSPPTWRKMFNVSGGYFYIDPPLDSTVTTGYMALRDGTQIISRRNIQIINYRPSIVTSDLTQSDETQITDRFSNQIINQRIGDTDIIQRDGTQVVDRSNTQIVFSLRSGMALRSGTQVVDRSSVNVVNQRP